MSRRFKFLPLALAILAGGILAASCGPGSGTAQYRVVQTIPDAPGNFDISVAGKNAFTNVGFGSTEPISGYRSVSAGSDPIEVFQTGTTPPVIESTNLDLTAGTQSTVLLLGLYAAPTALALPDNNVAPLSGQVELRVVDASPSAPASLDIYMVAPGTDITQRQPTIPPLLLSQQSAYLGVMTEKSGNAQIMMIVTKSGDPAKTQLVNRIFTLSDGQIRTLVLVDDSPGGGALAFSPLELNDLN